MSAKGRGSTSSANELYVTPDWCVDLIFKARDPQGLKVLEPGCDKAPFLKKARELGAARTVGFEERLVEGQEWIDKLVIGDYTDTLGAVAATGERFNMIIMNPPFSLTEKFIETSLRLLSADGSIIVLQRLNWLSGADRTKKFHSKGHLRHTHVLSNRPRFIKGKSGDACEYGYLVFNNECDSMSTLNHLIRK